MGIAYWGEAGKKDYLCGADKDTLMTNIKLVRDALSQEDFVRKRGKAS